MTETNEFLQLIKRMYRSNNAILRGWSRRLEDAYWREKQLPLFKQNQPDGDSDANEKDDEGGET